MSVRSAQLPYGAGPVRQRGVRPDVTGLADCGATPKSSSSGPPRTAKIYSCCKYP